MPSKKEIVVLKDSAITIDEKDIKLVQMYANGMSRNDMSKKTNKSVRTVEARIDKIKLIVNAKSIPNLIAFFFRNNLIK